jgi:hypothetical protein
MPGALPDGQYSLTFCEECGNALQPQDFECSLCGRARNGTSIPRHDSLPSLQPLGASSGASPPVDSDPEPGFNWEDEAPTTPMPETRTKSGTRLKSEPGDDADLDDCVGTRQKK